MFIFRKLGWAVLQPGNLLVLVLSAGFLLLLLSLGRRGVALIGLATLGFLVLASGADRFCPAARTRTAISTPRRITGQDRWHPRTGRHRRPGPFAETVFTGSVARILAAIALARQHPEAKLTFCSSISCGASSRSSFPCRSAVLRPL